MADKSLIWSTRALTEYRKLVEYLLDEWNAEIAAKVTNELDQAVNRIQTSPEQFPFQVKARNIRRCVMSPQTSIFFKATKTSIEVISLFDNRQDPKKRKL
jgi:plasmid stabilization system protein ParE